MSRPVTLLFAVTALATQGQARAAEAEGARQFHPDIEKHLDKVPPLLRDTRPPVPKDQDAYPIWCEAARKLKKLDDDQVEEAFEQARQADRAFPDGEAGRRLKAWLGANREALELFDAGVQRGRCRFPEPLRESVPDAMWAELGAHLKANVLGICRIELVRAKMLASGGEHERAASVIARVFDIAEVVKASNADTLEYLQAITADALSYGAIEWFIRQPDMPRGPLEHLLSAMKPAPQADEHVANMLRTSFRNWVLGSMDQLARDIEKTGVTRAVWADAIEQARAKAKGKEGEAIVKAFLERSPHPLDVPATIQLAAPFYLRAIRCAGGPWSARDRMLGTDCDKWAKALAAEGEQALEKLLKLVAEPKEPTPEFARTLSQALHNVAGKRIAWSVSPSFTGILGEYSFRARTRHEGTRALLALRIYALKHKQLPASLDALVEDKILPSVPRDFFADKPLRYSREKAIIWSVGPNEVDDGGDKTDQGDSKGPKDIVWEIPFARNQEGAKRE